MPILFLCLIQFPVSDVFDFFSEDISEFFFNQFSMSELAGFKEGQCFSGMSS